MPRKILFITWDGPQTSYMEGLFMPIYHEIQSKSDYVFHVVQFTWGDASRTSITKAKADELGIVYSAHPVYRKPKAALGSIVTLFQGIRFLNQYVKSHQIDIVMPRSTMPSIMVNRMKKTNFKILFDADGLALEERVDFSGLSRASKQYQFLKKEEEKMLRLADHVITRSQKAIEIHLKTIGNQFSEKFSVVSNGRNVDFFSSNQSIRKELRSKLGFSEHDFVFVYCGSLGAQYGWEEMITLFSEYRKTEGNSKFLILTGNPEFTKDRIPSEIQNSVQVLKVPFAEVSSYLSVADLAFAIREPKFSMQGVAPIKLGEYLLMGLPTIASSGIGDSETLLEKAPYCFLFQHDNPSAVSETLVFIKNLKNVEQNAIREFGLKHFSIAKSAQSYIASLDKIAHLCKE